MAVSKAARLAGTAGAVVLLAATLGLAAPAQAAQGQILGLDLPTAVKGSYIVVLKDSAKTATTMTSKYGGTVKYQYSAVFQGFAADMSEAQARRLAADPSVASVEADQVMRIDATQTNPPSWGLDRIDQANLPLNNAYNYSTTASNVHAYIIDTGIKFTHTTFGGRATLGTDAVTPSTGGVDCQGHGTHVAGTVGGSQYGVAKAVQLVAVRVLGCDGSGTTAGVIAGVNWVTQHAIKPAVANMSLGGGASTTLDTAVRNSIASGVTYAIASGNSNANACNSSPARVTQAITVNATQSNDARASFSNFGTCTDIFAPGVNITSSWGVGSNTATNTISGTSMATPHVAGAAALYLAKNPTASAATVASQLIAKATPNKVTNPGSGSPNRLLNTSTL
ncbi:S8 family peptidase [Actinocrispum sp. NPDC049592]|uniref:S8 family peptidase n=1 Tax=Actinocrispum sp. NPDC049592 TaxID=3154835 RepID=UPI0034303935